MYFVWSTAITNFILLLSTIFLHILFVRSVSVCSWQFTVFLIRNSISIVDTRHYCRSHYQTSIINIHKIAKSFYSHSNSIVCAVRTQFEKVTTTKIVKKAANVDIMLHIRSFIDFVWQYWNPVDASGTLSKKKFVFCVDAKRFQYLCPTQFYVCLTVWPNASVFSQILFFLFHWRYLLVVVTKIVLMDANVNNNKNLETNNSIYWMKLQLFWGRAYYVLPEYVFRYVYFLMFFHFCALTEPDGMVDWKKFRLLISSVVFRFFFG